MACRHGPNECVGNLYQHCVEKYTPLEHRHDWFMQFLLCTWDQDVLPHDKAIVKLCLDKVSLQAALASFHQLCVAWRPFAVSVLMGRTTQGSGVFGGKEQSAFVPCPPHIPTSHVLAICSLPRVKHILSYPILSNTLAAGWRCGRAHPGCPCLHSRARRQAADAGQHEGSGSTRCRASLHCGD